LTASLDDKFSILFASIKDSREACKRERVKEKIMKKIEEKEIMRLFVTIAIKKSIRLQTVD
jgi:hypothetical protein